MKWGKSKKATARELRRNQTKSEALLWGLLRAKRLCNLKFRRQHPIGPFVVDFACYERKLVVEVDGGYHDRCGEDDVRREQYLRGQGWEIIRFSDADVTDDPETVVRGIAMFLGLEYELKRRDGRGAGSDQSPS